MPDLSKKILTIILGGGKGTRLYPLTKERCKPAVPLGGKYRLIDIPISNSINSGFKSIYVVTQFMSASLNQHIVNSFMMDKFSNGFVSLIAATQTKGDMNDWFQGTADAVRKCQSIANFHKYEKVIILSGDHLYKMNYMDMLKTHTSKKAGITISVLPVVKDDVDQFGIMKIDEKGKIYQFIEKPTDPKIIDSFMVNDDFAEKNNLKTSKKFWLASMGIYLFDRKVLVDILMDENKIDFGKDVIPAALDNYNVQSHLFNDYWEDIGTIKSFYESNISLGKPNPKFDFYGSDETKIFTNQRFLMATKIGESYIKDSVVSDGCVIGNNTKINSSVIGLRAKIGDNVTVDESIIMGADYYLDSKNKATAKIGIADGAIVKKAILDKNVFIGKGAKILNTENLINYESENYSIKDGIIVIPKNSVIPDGTII